MKKSQLKWLIKEVISEMSNKPSLHKELLAVRAEIKRMRSYLNYGETISGSYVKDYTKLGELVQKEKDLLNQLKAN